MPTYARQDVALKPDRSSRLLGVGDWVSTDYSGKVTVHQIIERRDGAVSQSGILFQLAPLVPKSSGGWIDADWFKPHKHEGASK